MSRVKYKTSAQKEWNKRTSTIRPHKYQEPFFHDLLKGIISSGKGKSCIELGAIPGNYLVYFNKEYGYTVTGLDFSKHSNIFSETMKVNGIKNFKFINADILNFDSSKKYDLVCSFGFIEHFDDIHTILQKHVTLLSDGGVLLITVPNFRYLQWLYHKIFDKDNLSIHNIEAMKPKKIDKTLQGLGLQKIINQPFGVSEFWYEDTVKNTFLHDSRQSVTRGLNARLHKIRDNHLTSPYLIYLYKKP